MRKSWSKDYVEFVKFIYPGFSNKELSEHLQCTHSRLEAFGRRHHLKKVPVMQNKDGFIALDLKDEKFGMLTAIYNTGKKSKNNYLWYCKCDCGNEVTVRASLLRNGKKTHCGCMPPACGKIHHRRGGFGDIGGSQWSKIKSHAKERGLDFEISVEYAWGIFLSQDGICPLSGMQLKFPETFKNVSGGTASLDRIDSSLPYIEGNIQWVHKHINMMKHSHTEDYFFELCANVTNHQQRNK